MVMLGIRPVMGPRTRRFGELAPRALDPLDLDAATRIQIFAMLNNYLYGFVHREIAWEQTRSAAGSPTSSGARRCAATSTRRAAGPRLRRALGGERRAGERAGFEFGLDCFVEGVAVLVAR
jgi:hypothetical protein